MIMKKSDMLDRWTILLMKARQDEGAKQELIAYDQDVREVFLMASSWYGFPSLLAGLTEANAKIWVHESAMRAGRSADGSDTGLKLEEIGRRALVIRDLNKLRCESKQGIDVLFGEVPDKKVDHASQ